MLINCPKCEVTLRKGSWEIFTHCPSCGAEWPVDPDEPQRVKRRIVRNTILWTLLALVPVIGIVGGMVGAFWGYLAVKIKWVVLGTAAMIIGIVVGAMGQSLLAWWAFGEWDQGRCQTQLDTLAASLRTYRQRTGHLPTALADVSRLGLPAPTECPGGGGAYFYMPPVNHGGLSRPTSRPSAATNQPTVDVEATTATAPAPGDARRLLVAELIQGHRRFHMGITADLEARAIGQSKFDKLMAEPQNAGFARKFWPAWAAATQPDKKPQPAKPARPATSTAASGKAASAPATAAGAAK